MHTLGSFNSENLKKYYAKWLKRVFFAIEEKEYKPICIYICHICQYNIVFDFVSFPFLKLIFNMNSLYFFLFIGVSGQNNIKAIFSTQ